MQRKINSLLEEYGESHNNSTNKFIHWICVPAIFWSIIALLHSIPNDLFTKYIWSNDFASWAGLVLLCIFIYYLTLSINLAIGMTLFGYFCIFICVSIENTFQLSLPIIAIVVFILAWLGQFYGHQIEGKKPSFIKDLQFLLIGPAWLLHFIYKKIGMKY
mgnify:CR=1 FL=1|tara:strand:+ start:3783 stop:4262 length:480 start_codon:yes stop_codon:yes gene_type:complete